MSFPNVNQSTAIQGVTNSTTANSSSDQLPYAISGACVLIINLSALAVLFSNRFLLRRSALITGITLGNFLLGFFLFASGTYRSAYKGAERATLGNCVSTIFPVIYPLAFNTESVFFFLGGLERFLAIVKPNWFRQKWTPKNSWRLTIGACAFVVLTVIAGLVWAIFDHPQLTWQCAIPILYPKLFIKAIPVVSALGGACGAVLTIVALVAGLRRMSKLPLGSGESSRVRRQVQLTKSMATVSGADVILVVVPNLITFLSSVGVAFPDFVKPWNASYAQAANAAVAFFAFLTFNVRFRNAAVKLFHFDKASLKMRKIFGFGLMPLQQNQVKPSQVSSGRILQINEFTVTGAVTLTQKSRSPYDQLPKLGETGRVQNYCTTF